LICAACNAETATDPCSGCGGAALLDGRYRVVRTLGSGAFGTTWLAVRVEDGLEVAIKEIPVRADAKSRELIAREVAVLRQLHHPEIPAYIEDFRLGTGRSQSHCVVQEYIAGPTLAAVLAGRRFTADEAIAVLEALLPVLEYLHGLSPPVIHRDLKPGNVIVRPDGRYALVDFGSVRDAFKGSLGGSTVTGTFGYMAPEQFHGEATPATDLYGLGMIGLALVTRKDPASLHDFEHRVNWRAHADVPPAAGRLFDALIAPEARDRPSGVRAVRALMALRGLEFDEPVRDDAPRVFEPPMVRAAAWAVPMVGIGGVVAAIVAIVVFVPVLLASVSADVLTRSATALPNPPEPAAPTIPPRKYSVSPRDSRSLSPWEVAMGLAVDASPRVQDCLASYAHGGSVVNGTLVVTYGKLAFVSDIIRPEDTEVERCLEAAIHGFTPIGFTFDGPSRTAWTVHRLARGTATVQNDDAALHGYDRSGVLKLSWPGPGRLVAGVGTDDLVVVEWSGSVTVEHARAGRYSTATSFGDTVEDAFYVAEGETCQYSWTGARWTGACTP
jgi:serine/threonine protein kinase